MSTFTVNPLYPGLLGRFFLSSLFDLGSNYVAAVAKADLSTQGSLALDTQVSGTTTPHHHAQPLRGPLFILNILLKLAYFSVIFLNALPTSSFDSRSVWGSGGWYWWSWYQWPVFSPYSHLSDTQDSSHGPPHVSPWPLDSNMREFCLCPHSCWTISS